MMKKLGLIGGTSWHSTIEYYRIINQKTNDQFGDNTNPPLLLFNLNQAIVHESQRRDDWKTIADMVIDAANRLIAGGAEAVMCCANTPHRVFDDVQEHVGVPILHIGDATADHIRKQGVDSVGFIGTKFTMNEDFVTRRIARNGIQVMVPESDDERNKLHQIIQDELTFGKILPESKSYVIKIVNSMIAQGAQGIVLGCTEFPLMIGSSDLSVPIFNTTQLHAEAAVRFVLNLEQQVD